MLQRLPPFLPCGVLLLGSLLGIGLTGCSQDVTIRTYTVPVERARMLGAMLRHGEEAWFFKLSGPAKDVAQVDSSVRKFLKSVKFEKNEPVWELPAGWSKVDAPSNDSATLPRYATLKIAQPPLELTVHSFPVPSGMSWEKFQLANVNRWRGELEQGELELIELPDETSKLAMGGTEALFLDVMGTTPQKIKTVAAPFGATLGAGMAGGQMPSASGSQEPPKLPFTFTAPKEWATKRPGQFQLAAWEVAESETKRVDVTISAAMGGLVDNVNRWRGQIGLPAMSNPEELKNDAEPIELGARQGVMVRLTGPEESIYGAIIAGGDQTWFFKLRGPNDMARQEEQRFTDFVKSVKFE